MTTSRHRGEVERGTQQSAAEARSALAGKRPAGAVMVGDGLQICLRAIKGLTKPSVLRTPFYFQCPPLDALQRQYGHDFNDYQTVRHGQLSRSAGVRLATIQFATLFVDYNAPWTNLRPAGYVATGPPKPGSVPNPVLLARDLISLVRTGTPFELIVGQHRLWGRNDLHWGPASGNAATLRDLQVEERAAEVDARYINATFTEYRSVELVRRGMGSSKRRDPHRGRDYPVKVTVTSSGKATWATGTATNVSLYKLAKNFYGEQSAWTRIAKVNGIKGFAGSRPLKEWLASRHEKRAVLTIPGPPIAHASADFKTRDASLDALSLGTSFVESAGDSI